VEQIEILKIGKASDQLQPSHVGKENGELWSIEKKVIGMHVDPPKINFFGRPYFHP